ncbi:MAG: OmpA family protein [Kiritimatiellae bacterium]|nr:OmpA family protein [Kiritimatiellia bacterium]
MKSKYASFFLVAAAVAMTAGCRTKPPAGGEGDLDSDLSAGGWIDGDGAIGASALPGGNFQDLPRVDTPAGVYPVYFAYNDSSIPAGERAKIAVVANFMRDNPGVVLVVEGNCDERGTNEYNMSLGEYRAGSVRDALAAEGVSGQRIQTVSYGEERPAVFGSDESAWSQNRRAEFAFYKGE